MIDRDGAVYADNVYVDTIQITDFEDYNYLKQHGDNFWETVDGWLNGDQGNLFSGNRAIRSSPQCQCDRPDGGHDHDTPRAYEAGQKMIQTQDSLLNHSVNDVGKV